MATTKEKHFSECLHLINEVMERTTGWLLSRTLLPWTVSVWSISKDEERFCQRPTFSIVTKFWRNATIIKLPMFPADNIQIKDKLFSPPLNYFRKGKCCLIFSCRYFIWHVLGPPWGLSQMHIRTSPGTFHRLIFYTGLSISGFKMQNGNDAAPAHGIMLTHRVMRNKWSLLDFFIKAKT